MTRIQPGQAELFGICTMPKESKRLKVLFVDDDPEIVQLIAEQLKPKFDLRIAKSLQDGFHQVAKSPPDILATDLHVRDKLGTELLEWANIQYPHMGRILITGTGSIKDAAIAINRCRIHGLILKPWDEQDLFAVFSQVGEAVKLVRSHDRLLQKQQKLNQTLERRVAQRTAELARALQKIEEKNRILEKTALTDVLTDMPNRRAIELIAKKELSRLKRHPAPLTVALIDADNFKDINDKHTLTGGDHVLVWLGKKLHAAIRESDEIGRIGGEEFMVVAPNTDEIGAAKLAERLQGDLAKTYTRFKGKTIKVTVSIGLAVLPKWAQGDLDSLRNLAAMALTEAKNSGRNCYRVATLKN